MSELLTPMQAARVAGVSYPTLKQWIYKGKIHTTKTAGGHTASRAVKLSGLSATAPSRSEVSQLDWMRSVVETNCRVR